MTMHALLVQQPSLFDGLAATVELDAPLGGLTWFKVGGCADALVTPKTTDALSTLVTRCHETGTPLRVLGSGANLLVADEGVDGVVVRLDAPCFHTVEFDRDGPAPVRAWAGADLMKLVQECARRGLDGLSQLAGIPASVGGAITMNAGGAFGDTAQAVSSVGMLTHSGVRSDISAAEAGFSYRHTNLPRGIVLWADLALMSGDRETIRARVKEIFAYKSRSQPMADRSAGCMFRNPVEASTGLRTSAGRLIDEAKLKGFSCGGAYVSPVHGNFIALREGGSATDVLAVAAEVQLRVLERTGVRLEREVVVWSRRGELP